MPPILNEEPPTTNDDEEEEEYMVDGQDNTDENMEEDSIEGDMEEFKGGKLKTKSRDFE